MSERGGNVICLRRGIPISGNVDLADDVKQKGLLDPRVLEQRVTLELCTSLQTRVPERTHSYQDVEEVF